jgi:hypothetical protein
MLFELTDDHKKLKPVPFDQIDRTEKHLEHLIAKHLFDVCFSRRLSSHSTRKPRIKPLRTFTRSTKAATSSSSNSSWVRLTPAR